MWADQSHTLSAEDMPGCHTCTACQMQALGVADSLAMHTSFQDVSRCHPVVLEGPCLRLPFLRVQQMLLLSISRSSLL